MDSLDCKEIRVPLEPLEPECQVGGIRVGLHKIHPTGNFIQSIGSQLIF